MHYIAAPQVKAAISGTPIQSPAKSSFTAAYRKKFQGGGGGGGSISSLTMPSNMSTASTKQGMSSSSSSSVATIAMQSNFTQGVKGVLSSSTVTPLPVSSLKRKSSPTSHEEPVRITACKPSIPVGSALSPSRLAAAAAATSKAPTGGGLQNRTGVHTAATVIPVVDVSSSSSVEEDDDDDDDDDDEEAGSSSSDSDVVFIEIKKPSQAINTTPSKKVSS